MRALGGIALLLAACGARTGLDVPSDAGVLDAPRDAPMDAPIEAPPDAPPAACTLTSERVLATNQSPDHLLIDDAYVYWVNDDATVRRVPKNGGTVEDVGTLPSPPEFGFALDDSFVYGGGMAIGRIPKSGGSSAFVASGDSAYGFAADAQNLFWGEIGGSVRRVAKSGGPVADLAFVQGGAERVAVDDANVYFTAWAPPSGGLWRVPIAGGSAEQLSTAPYSDYIAMDATAVYWSSLTSPPSNGGIWKVDKATSTVTLLTATDQPQGTTVDAAYVYWAESFDHISRVPKAGGAVTVLYPNEMNARSVAVDASCIYWSLDPIVGEIHAGPL